MAQREEEAYRPVEEEEETGEPQEETSHPCPRCCPCVPDHQASMAYHLLIGQCAARFSRLEHPVRWMVATLVINIAIVAYVAVYYTETMCETRTEFVNAGKILGPEMAGRNWIPPAHMQGLVTDRISKNDGVTPYKFVSWAGNYPFMTEPNIKLCSTAMSQLRCECYNDQCETDVKEGPDGYIVRSSFYRSDPEGAGANPNKPCVNVFNDCFMDGFTCDDYHSVEAGCPKMPIGDPVGNRPLSIVKDFTPEEWEWVGRCDPNELCNGLTGVQYLECKKLTETIPLAMAWVTVIELVVAMIAFLVTTVCFRPNPLAPLTIQQLEKVADFAVLDPQQREELKQKLREGVRRAQEAKDQLAHQLQNLGH